MIFTKIRLIGLTTLEIPVIGALPKDPYIVKGIDGLGPPDFELFMAESYHEGGNYSGRRAKGRQIVALLGLNPNHRTSTSVSSLRDALYTLVGTDQNEITFELMEGNTVVARTAGFVSKIEPSIFVKDPAVQLTIDSEKAFLEAPTPVILTPNTHTLSVVNPGTAPSSFRLRMNYTAANSTSGDRFQVRVGGLVLDLDYIPVLPDNTTNYFIVDTRLGSRQVVRDGVYNLVGNLARDSKWPYLRPGANLVEILEPFGSGEAHTGYSIVEFEYLPRYMGV